MSVEQSTISSSKEGGLVRIPRWRGLVEARQMASNPIAVLDRHLKTHGPTFRYSFGGVQDTIVTTDPAIMRHVLKSQHKNYHKSTIQTRVMAEFLGDGLLTDHFEEWRPKRQRLSGAFHPSKMDDLAHALHAVCDETLAELETKAAAGPVGFKAAITKTTFAMAARSFFGMSFPLKDIARLSQNISTVQTFMTKLVAMPFMRPWWQFSGEIARQQTVRRKGDAILLKQIETRLKTAAGAEPDLLDMLLAMTEPDDEIGLTLPNVLAEAMQFLVAGHETSSNAFSWVMLMLDKNPDVAAEIREEFDTVLGSRRPLFSDMADLVRANAAIEEALRLFPPFWMIDRVALEDDSVAGLDIPKGTVFILFLYGLHRDPTLWSQPERFQGDRFDNKLQQNRDFIHLPFGAGPRRCIGMTYAKLQLLVLLHRFLTGYSVDFPQKAATEIDPKFILGPKGEIPVQMTRKTPLT